jgi:hypothetical protein
MEMPIPDTLRHLIEVTNTLLQNYQQELQSRVLSANTEMMQILNLNPSDGWRLDMQRMVYVKTDDLASNPNTTKSLGE